MTVTMSAQRHAKQFVPASMNGRQKRKETTLMPTYDYRCSKCGHEYERIESLREHERKHTCPKCRSEKIEHMVTPFYAQTSRKS